MTLNEFVSCLSIRLGLSIEKVIRSPLNRKFPNVSLMNKASGLTIVATLFLPTGVCGGGGSILQKSKPPTSSPAHITDGDVWFGDLGTLDDLFSEFDNGLDYLEKTVPLSTEQTRLLLKAIESVKASNQKGDEIGKMETLKDRTPDSATTWTDAQQKELQSWLAINKPQWEILNKDARTSVETLRRKLRHDGLESRFLEVLQIMWKKAEE